MTNRILKYQIPVQDKSKIELPIGSKILKFGMQGNDLFIWVLTWEDSDLEEKHFRLVGTGHEFDYENSSLRYIDSVLDHLNRFVWHLFEVQWCFEE